MIMIITATAATTIIIIIIVEGTFLLHISELLGPDVGPETDYPRGFSWFFPVPPGKFWDSTFL
jgi:hypothetical protein